MFFATFPGGAQGRVLQQRCSYRLSKTDFKIVTVRAQSKSMKSAQTKRTLVICTWLPKSRADFAVLCETRKNRPKFARCAQQKLLIKPALSCNNHEISATCRLTLNSNPNQPQTQTVDCGIGFPSRTRREVHMNVQSRNTSYVRANNEI